MKLFKGGVGLDRISEKAAEERARILRERQAAKEEAARLAAEKEAEEMSAPGAGASGALSCLLPHGWIQSLRQQRQVSAEGMKVDAVRKW